MNLFRKWKYWMLPVLIGVFLALFGVKELCNGVVADILQMYFLVIKNAVVFGLILPAMFLLVLNEAGEFMKSRRLLAINSRCAWWNVFCRKILADCFGVTVVILLPAFLAAKFCMGAGKGFWEWGYVFFLLLTSFLFFSLMAFCMMLLEIKFQQNILSVCFVLVFSFMPNIFSFLFRLSGIPDVSGLLNLGYAVDDTAVYSGMKNGQGIHWLWCLGVCAVLFAILLVLERVGRILIKRQDIFWK